MGQLENNLRRRLRRKELQKIVLGTIALAGMLSVAAVAPNVIGALAKLKIISPTKRRREIINRARERLLKEGMLKRDVKGFLLVTSKGAALLRRLELADFNIKKPKRWDKKWRLLIFDIPESRKNLRNKVRLTLIALGFKRLQDSAWVYPYDCEDLIALLKADFKIGKNLIYIITEEIEGDSSLRKTFGLHAN